MLVEDIREYKRYSDLTQRAVSTPAKLDQTLENRDASSAAVDQAQAPLDQAAITYGCTQITSP